MNTHTPGPSDRLALFINNATLPAYLKRQLAEILADMRKTEGERAEMLEALTWALDIIDGSLAGVVHAGHGDYDNARAAIAKAEGGTE